MANTLSLSSIQLLLLVVVAATTWASYHPVSGFTGNPNVSTRGHTGHANSKNKHTTTTQSLFSFSALFAQDNDDEYQHLLQPSQPQSRREIIRSSLLFSTGGLVVSSFGFNRPMAYAASGDDDDAAGGGSSSVSLLEQFGTDPSKITQKSNNDAASRAAVTAKPKTESTIEPNLRSNYYYPTNKKRYLPRIKKCNDAIPDAAEAIGTGNWDVAEEFVNKIADDTILPLKLYTSSLTGGGTNVKVSFTKDMFKAADDFEKAQKELVKAVKKRDQKVSSKALEDLSSALSAYRVAGKLTGPDAGGDIPSVDEIRRSACRVQGRTFEQKVKARDARLAEAMAAAAKENGGN